MGEKFEVRLMEIMLERSKPVLFGEYNDDTEFIEPWEAIDCVRKMLAEFDAVIYQP